MKHRRRQLNNERMAHELRRQGMRIVRRLPHLQQIAREDRLQPDGAEALQQRGAPNGHHHTLLRLLQYGDVEPGHNKYIRASRILDSIFYHVNNRRRSLKGHNCHSLLRMLF